MERLQLNIQEALGAGPLFCLLCASYSFQYPYVLPSTVPGLPLPNPSLLPLIPSLLVPLRISPVRSAFSKGFTGKISLKAVEKTTGKIKGNGKTNCVCVCTLIISQALSHVNFLALEGRDPLCYHLTNQEAEAQRGAVSC